jgi:hypothetical protein
MRKFLSTLAVIVLAIFCVKAQNNSFGTPRHGNAINSNTTVCNVIAVTNDEPWLDDFSTNPECWTFPTANNSAWEWNSTQHLISHEFGIYESDAISPILDISDVVTPYLKFAQKRPNTYGICDYLYVYFRSTTANEDTTWRQLGSYTTACNDWFIDSLPLPQNMTTIQLKFHAVGYDNNGDGVEIDYVNVYNEYDAPSCIAPTALNVYNIGNYSVTLTWSLISIGSVDLFYRMVSDDEYTHVENVTLTDGGYFIDDLEASSQYEWYLVMDCGWGEYAQTPMHYFTTACGLVNTPRYEGFEYVEFGESPACWKSLNNYDQGTASFPAVISGFMHNGNNCYKFKNHYNSNTPQYAILPEFDNDFNTLQMNFWTRREGPYSGTFSVGYVTNPQDGNSFVSLMTFNANQMGDNSYHNYTLRFDTVTTVVNAHYYIAFKYECDRDAYWFLDDITIDEISICAVPDSLQASNATGSTIDLSWTGNAETYTLKYRVLGETEYTTIGNVTLNAEGVYTLGGLSGSTNYEWYVIANCPNGSSSESYVTGYFTTECGTISSVPVSWDLESNNTGGTSDYPLPTCWSRITNSTAILYPYVLHQSSNAHNSGNSLRYYNFYPNSYAILPAIDNSLPLAYLQLSFYAKITQENAVATLEVGVMTNPNDASTFTRVSTITPSASYTQYEISFLSYTGSGKYIAIKNASSAPNNLYTYTFVDDITLSPVSGCTTPINLTAITSTNSATLSWVSTGTTFTVYYREVGDNSWQSVGNVSLDNNREYELTGLNDGTAYDWYVETSCGTTPELASEHAYFTTIMEPVDLPYQTDFSNGEDWLMNNGHANNYWKTGIPSESTQASLFITTDGTTAGYSTTANTVVTAEKAFNMPESNTVHVEFDVEVGGEGDTNHTPADYLKVFLAPNTVQYTTGATSSNEQSSYNYSTYAFNFSNYLSQTAEHQYPYKLCKTQDSMIHISIDVTNPDINGAAKIVFLWRNDNFLGAQPGAIIRNFHIIADTSSTPPTPPTPLTCAMPTNVSISNLSPNSAVVSWTAGEDESAWNIQYKAASASSWGNSIHVTSTSYNLSGLTAETAYQVRVQAECLDTISAWTAPVNFTTPEEVGIDNLSLSQNISLMPNPANSYIELRISSNVEVKEAVIYNAFGQMIQAVALTDNHARIDLSNMAAGMYFVRVNGEGVSATKKFIKR